MEQQGEYIRGLSRHCMQVHDNGTCKCVRYTCWPVEGKVSASKVRLSQTGEAASFAAKV